MTDEMYDKSLYVRIKEHIKGKYKTGDLLYIGNPRGVNERPYMCIYVVVENEAIQGSDYNGVFDIILSSDYLKKIKSKGVKYKTLLTTDYSSKLKQYKIDNATFHEMIIPYDEDDIIKDLKENNLY